MRKYYVSYITIISILSLACINNISALSYQSEVGIGFTFNPTLSISLDSSDLAISNLTPGTTGDSNSISVNVATNAAYGYTLSATVDNTNLTHTNETNTFSSIATNANLANLDADNTWGYSYKNNLASTPTWSNYSGLSTSTSKVLFNTDSNTSSSIDFKIGAKASNTQASGTYTNTINFIVVSKPMPKTIDDIAYMQTFGELNATDLASVKNSMIKDTTYTLKDQRDEQEYTVAKLEDGKIWMTKNLNLAGGTEITSELSDVPKNYTLPTANGFQEGNRLPASSQEGFSDNTQAYVYNTGNNTDNCTSPGCYSYYSWLAATAGNTANINERNEDTPYSICPKGWGLPSIRTDTAQDWQADSDIYTLVNSYGVTYNGTMWQGASVFFEQAGPNTTPNLLLSGYYADGTFNSGTTGGRYWSSTSLNRNSAFQLLLSYSDKLVNFAAGDFRKNGASTRCLAR